MLIVRIFLHNSTQTARKLSLLMNTLHNGLVSVKVYEIVGGRFAEIILGDMNHLGRFAPGKSLLLRFVINKSDSCDHVVPVTTNREKTMAMMLPSVLRLDARAFEHEVHILPGDKPGRVKVDNNKNLVRFLVMSKQGSHRVEERRGDRPEGRVSTSPPRRPTACRPIARRKARWRSPTSTTTTTARAASPASSPSSTATMARNTPSRPCRATRSPPFRMRRPSRMTTPWSCSRGPLSNGVGVGLRKDGRRIKLHWSKVNVADRVPVYLFEGEIIVAKSFSPVPNAQPGSLDVQAEDMTRTEEMIAV